MADKISVIVPTFNRVDLIAETLDSLLCQTRRPDEILVIDDGSTDGTGDVVKAYGDAIRYMAKPNGGKASALNLAMEQVSGDLIWICDDDDLILPETCARLAACLEADSKLGFAAGRHEDFIVDSDSGERIVKAPGYWRPSLSDEIFPDLLDGCHIFQPGLIVRRSVYDAVGPFDEAFIRSQDYEMMLRIARHARGVLLPETVYLHREHGGARGSAKERFTPEEANAKWIKFHRMIFEPLMAELADTDILPASLVARPDIAPITARVAAFKRAGVYARHMMWPEAMDTYEDIAARAEGPDLTDVEQRLVKQATGYSFGCGPLYEDPEIRRRAMALKSISPRGRQIANLLGASMMWRIKCATKSGNLPLAAQLTGFVASARL
ncbi:MAG: glycosyltransferase [Pseudomonadota bacterium]